MLTHRRLPASLSVVSLDLPIHSTFETVVTLYQRAPQRFHVLIDVPTSAFDYPEISDQPPTTTRNAHRSPNPVRSPSPAIKAKSRLLWLEISPTRAIFTSQSKTGLSYRHMWEQGTYGISRYWLTQPTSVQSPETGNADRMRLRNFTRSFTLTGNDYPKHLRLEYELWAQQLKLGTYVLNLDVRA
ncbi:MAG: hypothetical protein EAZ61_08960 [Oscillatoriales cyanobacterium]|nr:MAG: hypothetical protein EAZ61_08960 [Oscillatoriales cyanobacterium]